MDPLAEGHSLLLRRFNPASLILTAAANMKERLSPLVGGLGGVLVVYGAGH